MAHHSQSVMVVNHFDLTIIGFDHRHTLGTGLHNYHQLACQGKMGMEVMRAAIIFVLESMKANPNEKESCG